MMNSIELKPCPFCGGEASTKIEVVHGKTADYIIFKIYCYKCKIERYVSIQSDHTFESAEKAKQEVIEAWNRRADNNATPVKCGEWIMNSDRPDTIICSKCNVGFDIWKHEQKYSNFCPNCGAKMD